MVARRLRGLRGGRRQRLAVDWKALQSLKAVLARLKDPSVIEVYRMQYSGDFVV